MVSVNKRRSFLRKTGFRDSQLIGIACEGSVTEKKYFETFSDLIMTNPSRVYIKVIERDAKDSGLSAPKYVISSIDEYRKENSFKATDEFWAVIDYDRWTVSSLSAAAKLASQKGYRFVVSRPCFEVWLILHLLSAHDLTAAEIELFMHEGCSAVEAKIREVKGQYSKNLNDASDYIMRYKDAIRNAKELDAGKRSRWPSSFGSRVYQVLEAIIG